MMNRKISIAVDVLFVIACVEFLGSIAFCMLGNETWQLYTATLACFCLLLAVLLCVYPRGRA